MDGLAIALAGLAVVLLCLSLTSFFLPGLRLFPLPSRNPWLMATATYFLMAALMAAGAGVLLPGLKADSAPHSLTPRVLQVKAEEPQKQD